MAEIEFDSYCIESKELDFLTDANLAQLRQLLIECYPELNNKRLLVFPSRGLIFGGENFPLHLLIYWQPREDCNLLVKYRTSLTYSEDDDTFLSPTDKLSVDFEMDEAAPEHSVIETLLEFGLVKEGQPRVQPDHSQKHATFFGPEALLVPIGHTQDSIALAFNRPQALLSSLHPLFAKKVKNYFWYDNEILATLAKEFYGSLTEPKGKLLIVIDSEPSVGSTPRIKASNFPKFPEAPQLPYLGLLEAQTFQPEANGFATEGFRLEFQASSTTHQYEEVIIFEGRGYNGRDFFEVSTSDWDKLKQLAGNGQTWSPPAFTGSWLRGGKWQLEWWNPPNHTIMSSILPPVGPFWDMYITILELAGLEHVDLNNPAR